jgi:hypothetical protein
MAMNYTVRSLSLYIHPEDGDFNAAILISPETNHTTNTQHINNPTQLCGSETSIVKGKKQI